MKSFLMLVQLKLMENNCLGRYPSSFVPLYRDNIETKLGWDVLI